MKLGLNQQARMEQRLLQSPQMIQAMQILQLGGLELQERIERELEENPFLERQESGEGETASDPEPESAAAAAEPRVADQETRERDSVREEFEGYEREYGDAPRRISEEELDRKAEAMANAPARARTLGEALLEQLAVADLDGATREWAEYLAQSLDGRGFLSEDLAELAAAAPGAPSLEDLEVALAALRRVAHPALGARSLAECLVLQLDPADPLDALARRVVSEHFDDLTHNRLPRIAKNLAADLEDVKAALERIRQLDLSPGSDYGDELAAPIVPEVLVEEVDGEWQVRLGRQRGPGLVLSDSAQEIFAKLGSGEAARTWAKQRLDTARWFIDALQQRQNTILRIARAVFAHQRAFLERGPRALRPLRMQDVADEIQVHLSTVSRAVSGKYAQTPRGIFPLKYFFSSGTTDASGAERSQVSVQERLADVVRAEDPQAPLSDDQIAEELERRFAIKIARRTVTKYRKALGIPPSGQRKSF